ncbi:MAG: prolyl-tRNA synthetase [Parcubacteria group bacterium Gr01-1014_106]|nr:MAG: prolyl-tRNA synthetase [Parcubacteria group bacterium Gr01-1014_106]
MHDILRQSHLFSPPLREAPKDAETVSHRLLTQGGFIHQLAAGIFSFLPLGFRVHRHIEQIIREEMLALGAQEILLPTLQPKALWEETGRWKTIDPPLFTTTDRHDRQYALAPTHEEVITDLARTYLHSYKQLPVLVFQIHTKFRNEQRPTGGLLRTREFAMKDLYSFHENEEDLIATYEKVKQAYVRIFERCGLRAIPVSAASGTIGGSLSHEFQVLADTGEDRVLLCSSCGFGANREALVGKEDACPHCGTSLETKNAIEGGHIFQLGQTYSDNMKAHVTTADGKKQPLVMGCYGIGLGRLLATVVEASHDDRGILWPASIAPFHVHVLELGAGKGDAAAVRAATEKLVQKLADAGFSVLHDDRDDASPGEKFADADRIGIPWRVVVSQKHVANGTVGIKNRKEKDERAIPSNAVETELHTR